MPFYDFECEECNAIISMEFSMNDTDGRNNAICPQCKNKVKRVISAPNVTIKSGVGDMKLGPTQKFVDVDGRPVVMNFIDHGNRSGLEEGSLVKKNIPGAHIDEKTGKPCVSVISNVPDPLGKLDTAKRKGDVDIRKKNINQKYKTRKKAKK